MTPYEQLRTRINELLPDRLKLEFGCEYRSRTFGYVGTFLGDRAIYIREGNHVSAEDNIDERAEEFEVLGKPLTIDDVLRALGTLKAEYVLSDSGLLMEAREGKEYMVRLIYTARFDLTKPLSDPANEGACAAVLKLLV